MKLYKGWKKDFVTMFLEQTSFKNKNDEIDKITKIFNLFAPFKAKFRFSTVEDDEFLQNLQLCTNYDLKIIKISKTFLRKKQLKLIEIDTDDLSFFDLIKLAIQHTMTLDFELKYNNQIKVIGVLYGDAGESHSIHFNTQIVSVEDIKPKLNDVFI